MEYKNYMFDLYGTLIDIRTDEHCAQNWKKWCRWLDARGIRHPNYIVMRRDFFELDAFARRQAKLFGPYENPEIDIIPVYRRMFARYGNGELPQEELEALSYAFREATRFYFKLFPGVPEYIERIHADGGKAYLLSNAQASYTRPEIEALGLDKMLDGILLSSDYDVMKPDKAYYEMCFEKFGLDKSKTVMIGDSLENDVLGAREAGIDAIHLSGENAASVFYLK